VTYGHSVRPALASSLLAAVLLLPVSGCDLVDKLDESGSSTQVVEIPGQGVSFEAPEDWDALDSSVVADAGASNGAWDEIADRMGIEPQQMKNLLEQTDVFIAAPHAEGGVLSNINALHFDGESLPSEATFKMQFRSLGATDIDSMPLSTDVGDGYRVEYSLNLKGQDMNGTALVLKRGTVILDITVTSSSPDTTEELADQIVNSLAETD